MRAASAHVITSAAGVRVSRLNGGGALRWQRCLARFVQAKVCSVLLCDDDTRFA